MSTKIPVSRFIDRGDLIFTKKLARGPEKGAFTVTTQTPLAAIVVGGTKGVKWSDKLLDQTIITMGLIYADDVCECLGDEAYEKLKSFLKEKYK